MKCISFTLNRLIQYDECYLCNGKNYLTLNGLIHNLGFNFSFRHFSALPHKRQKNLIAPNQKFPLSLLFLCDSKSTWY